MPELAQFLSLSVATAAIVIVQISLAISLAALVFSGELAPALSSGAGAFIVGGALASFIVGWRSSLPGIASGVQDTVAVLLATVVGPSTAALTGTVRTTTALVMVGVSSLIIGSIYFLLGRLRLGSLIRFIPHPVVGGFLAGTGWLMFRGGVDVMLNDTLTAGGLGDLLGGDQLRLLIPGLTLSVLIVVAVARRFPPISISIAIVASSALFYAATIAWSSVARAKADGWLIGPFAAAASWQPYTPDGLAATDWGAILDSAPSLGAIALVAVVGLLLNLTALENVADGEFDLDRELRVAGLTNVLVGGAGGGASYHKIGDTVLARRLGVSTRLVPMAVGTIGILAMVGGSQIIELMPRLVAGGILAGLGLSLLWEWGEGHIRHASWVDRILGAGILAAIARIGVLEGVMLGVVVAAALFVLQYGRIDPIRSQMSGRSVRSRVDRPHSVRTVLDTRLDAIEIVVLDGYLFFGSATRTADRIREQTQRERDTPLQFLIMDLARVTGMDASATKTLLDAMQQLDGHKVRVLLTGVSDELLSLLRTSGLSPAVTVMPSLDHAVEYCEESLLNPSAGIEATALESELRRVLGGRWPDLLNRCDRVEFKDGERIITAGASSDELYFIESGTLTVKPAGSSANGSRLRKVGAGSVLGELAFATGAARAADVFADGPVVVHEFSRQAFERMRTDDPGLAIDLQAFLLTILATRAQARALTVDDRRLG